MPYDVKVIADSIWNENRITSLACTYPRYIHSEMMTHRQFSRNASSSRAVPIEKMIASVLTDPVWPMWTANQKGMQGDELHPFYAGKADFQWQEAREQAVATVRKLVEIGVHKQNANRLLEPFSWITVLITATDWDNFFNLRVHSAAQPEMQKIAKMMFDAIKLSTPVERSDHQPFIQDGEDLPYWIVRPMVSAARCARISYLTHEGVRDVAKDQALADRLLKDKHLSPFEHVASAANGRFANFTGWQSYRNQVGC